MGRFGVAAGSFLLGWELLVPHRMGHACLLKKGSYGRHYCSLIFTLCRPLARSFVGGLGCVASWSWSGLAIHIRYRLADRRSRSATFQAWRYDLLKETISATTRTNTLACTIATDFFLVPPGRDISAQHKTEEGDQKGLLALERELSPESWMRVRYSEP